MSSPPKDWMSPQAGDANERAPSPNTFDVAAPVLARGSTRNLVWVAEHEESLARIAERLCATTADARDLVQDTFERAMRQGIPAEVRSVRAWLTTMMHNLFIDRCRTAARRPVHEPLDDSQLALQSPERCSSEPAWSRITLDDVRAALVEIDAPFRDVYMLHSFDRLTYEDIARRLGIERITVGTRLSRARKKLREVLVARFGLEDAP